MKYIVEILIESRKKCSEEMIRKMVEENMLRYADGAPFDISIQCIYTVEEKKMKIKEKYEQIKLLNCPNFETWTDAQRELNLTLLPRFVFIKGLGRLYIKKKKDE